MESTLRLTVNKLLWATTRRARLHSLKKHIFPPPPKAHVFLKADKTLYWVVQVPSLTVKISCCT